MFIIDSLLDLLVVAANAIISGVCIGLIYKRLTESQEETEDWLTVEHQ